MKKLFLLATSAIVIAACSNDSGETSHSSSGSELSKMIVLKESTNRIGAALHNYGATGIKCTNNNEGLIYEIQAKNAPMLFNGNEKISLTGMKFILKDNILYEDGHQDQYIKFENGEVYYKTTRIRDLKEIDLHCGLLLQFLDAITTKSSDLSLAKQQASRACPVEKQKYVIGYSLTSGGAVADLESGINTAWQNGELDCTPLDATPQMGTALGGMLVTATKTFCCDGKGGAGGTW